MIAGWHSNILHYLSIGDYTSVVVYYEELIEQEPDELANYWYLGLAYLLDGDEESAQTPWLMAIAQAPESETIPLTKELSALLQQEAERQLNNGDKFKCWRIRHHLREVCPSDLDNLLNLLLLEIELDHFDPSEILEWGTRNVLDQYETQTVDEELLIKALRQILKYPDSASIDLAKSSVRHACAHEQWVSMFIEAANDLGYRQGAPLLGIELIRLCLQLTSNALEALEHLPYLYLEAGQYQEAIQAATEFFNHSSTTELKFLSNAMLLKSMLSAGVWDSVPDVSQRYKTLLRQIIETQPTLSHLGLKSLVASTGQIFYLQDNLKENRWSLNEAAKLFSKNLAANSSIKLPLSHNYKPNQEKKLKIGYIAHTLRSHSVGWLSRWLFQYLDRNKFELYLYLFIQKQNDPFFHEWFAQRVDRAVLLVEDSLIAAEKIRDDKIDILIDLDSITLDHTVAVMSLKPAPIQATWLGWDASGLPSVDYFIADPYVIPGEAEQHYHEKILRLPQTYIAVNGFEIDVPTIRRSDLGIPGDSIVYFSSSVGIKCNPETVQLQLQIIKEVPNSYFLVKGLADAQSIQEKFLELAIEMGIAAERLKFLPMVSTEMIHRANLGITDIVLDTFPHNGATTALEALWIGIPLVTRVGSQFASRNSYSFLMNLGVAEGIAWSAEEYVEWGVRFGRDLQLRLDVAWKLRQSRKTSPLWNTKQFAKDMEQAYQSMWLNYIESYST
jgi:predicted O-linked N-acetylglucosamine transferase (SPINDLY family)